MRRKLNYTITITIAIAVFMLMAVGAANAQTLRPQASNGQIRTLLSRIDRETATVKQLMPTRQDRNDVQLADRITNFENSARTFRTSFYSSRVTDSDLTDLLSSASEINGWMGQTSMSGQINLHWIRVKNDVSTLARYYRVSWDPNQTSGALPADRIYFSSDLQLRNLIASLESKTNRFRALMTRSLNRSNVNDTGREDSVNAYVRDFENATDRLKQNFNSRRSAVADVTEVLNHGRSINQFIADNRLDRATESQWVSVRNDLNILASYYRVSWDWNRPATPAIDSVYAATDIQLRDLIARLERKTNTYRGQMNISLDNSRINNTNREDSINAYVKDFENATDRLKQDFNNRRSTVAVATEVLNRGRIIDQFMTSHRMNRAAENGWSSIRTDLDTLATYYRVSWNWDLQNPTYPGDNAPTGRLPERITGTYRLNTNRSDNVANVINDALRNYTGVQRENIKRVLERRLQSPEMIAIQMRNRTVEMASTNLPETSFDADGVGKTETNDRGRTVTTTVTADNDSVAINYDGDRINDFYLKLAPGANGQLNVTRRIYLENQNESVTVSSVYDRVSNTAQWSTVNNGTVTGVNAVMANEFYIPNGTRITATIRSTVSTRASQVGDKFTMEVTGPSQYRGAVIEGRVAQAADSGRVAGRANVSLSFDTITTNGRTYRFAGIIDSVNAANGDTVTVNNEGQVRDSNQTTKTVTRAGIGAAIGAIIGAIAGGGEGAAIGAGIGAGAGAGTVLIAGRDSIELGPGSTFNITATSPSSVGAIRN